MSTPTPTPIDKVKQDISDLEKQREDLFLQFKPIEDQLAIKKKILDAYIIVSSDLDLYLAWKEQANITPAPPILEPTPTPEPPNQ